MGERNANVEAALTELERFGLKGRVLERSKHLEVNWEYPDGRKRFTIVPCTSSDHRSALNTRGDVRRLLRADNVQPPLAKLVSFEKALQLPKPQDFAGARLAKLEQDVEALLDLVVELQDKLVETQTRLSNAKVTVSFDLPKPVEVLVSPVRVHAKHGSRSAAILNVLQGGRWTPRQEIASQIGMDVKNVSSALDFLRKKGQVERGQLGMWRKKIEPVAVAQ